jgi:nitrogen fixation/metabolism regulation signal transduction histidine kinase
VAETGRVLVDTVEPGDSTEASVIARHREALSRSLTQARRWAFLGERLTQAMPWLVLVVALALVLLAYAATRQLARQLAQPIEDLVVLAQQLGREEPLPPRPSRSTYEVRVLDETLRQAAEELEQARDRALVAERLRVWGEMARRVAHEMKNPLTPLRFAAHRLSRPGGEQQFREVVEVIEQEVGRLEELATQFRTLGRPPEGPATEIDLTELMGSLLTTDAPDIAHTIDSPPALPAVRGHYDAVFRAFRNLVRNAVEATEGADAPRIDVALRMVAEDETEWVEVRIRDNGPGLPPEGAERIFEPDFTTKTHGTGLGLAVVRQAITADGGSISARNAAAGAVFVVRLPTAGPFIASGKEAG